MFKLKIGSKDIVLILFIIFLSVSLIKTVFENRVKLERLDKLSSEVKALKDKVMALDKNVAIQQSPEYLEREARDKLGFVKMGEKTVILPDNGEVVKDNGGTNPVVYGSGVPNWKKWKRLIFD